MEIDASIFRVILSWSASGWIQKLIHTASYPVTPEFSAAQL
jgi:hypothetical protein